MDESGVAVPPELRELFEMLYERVEILTGWNLTSGRQGSLEIVRDGAGYTLYGKGKFMLGDLGEGRPEHSR
jgi:hypothetical protein